MKHLIHIAAIVAIVAVFAAGTTYTQVANEKTLNARVVSDGRILVGDQSTNSVAGPYFGGSLGYGLGSGVTVYVESGYGWTNYDGADGLRLVQVPLLGGLTYNFGPLLNSTSFEPYIGASAGAFFYSQQQNWKTVKVNGKDLTSTSFGLEGVIGIKYLIPNSRFGIDVRVAYDHAFSKRDNGNLLEQNDRNNIGIGGGISYNFSI
jgi:hypothetical protein